MQFVRTLSRKVRDSTFLHLGYWKGLRAMVSPLLTTGSVTDVRLLGIGMVNVVRMVVSLNMCHVRISWPHPFHGSPIFLFPRWGAAGACARWTAPNYPQKERREYDVRSVEFNAQLAHQSFEEHNTVTQSKLLDVMVNWTTGDCACVLFKKCWSASIKCECPLRDQGHKQTKFFDCAVSALVVCTKVLTWWEEPKKLRGS